MAISFEMLTALYRRMEFQEGFRVGSQRIPVGRWPARCSGTGLVVLSKPSCSARLHLHY
ncbi:hypothetical protein GQB29_004410 [Salmonella enterica]|uniref:Uncharacterized protein n=2 Tax=Salmonella enterica I TaxID=59201 RepID=A0A733VVC0_SALTI|nr:hypothetical protein [Salmonella enterica subsp. enterica serovar Typhi]EDN6572531.1 hypothetical protein [Salmonella enterica]EDW0075427.1 hypothetical protein [Salmonella enterica subsp. enterica serovar Paratyphi A]EDY0564930.1 hypothetical protein [Salmonella enterica subsp. enterica]HAE3905700.1 hypothetical protein [Salmonella enterica subsp. enterica serovar Typhimurium]